MKMAFRETIHRVRRPHVLIVVAFLVGAVIGVAIGPWTQVMCDSAILGWWPKSPAAVYASLRLADNDLGRQELREYMLSGDSTARGSAISELVHTEKPWDLLTWLGEIPETQTRERLRLLDAADYAEHHRFVLVALCMEMRDTQSEAVRAKAERILESFKDAQATAEAACRRMSSRNSRDAGPD